jgi:hypothetical protein
LSAPAQYGLEDQMNHQSMLASAILVVALAVPAAAQQRSAPTRSQWIGGGAQWAYPVDAQELSATPGLNVSVRRWIGPHFGIEGEFGWWQRSKSYQYRSPAYQTPDGVFGPIEVLSTSRLATYNLGMNVLGRVPMGRAAIVAGGGPGLFVEHGRSESLVNGTSNEWSATQTHFGLQSLVTLEVRVTDRLTAYGGFRTEMRNVRWVDSFVGYPTAGVRIGF